MKGKVLLLIAGLLLISVTAVAVGLLTRNGSDHRESEPTTPTPTEKPSSTAKPKNTATSDAVDAEANRRLVRAQAEQYIAALNAKDEATAAQSTCHKKDSGLLPVVAAGHKITLLDVEIGGYMPSDRAHLPAAGAAIQVEGRPSTPSIVFVFTNGEWCVYR